MAKVDVIIINGEIQVFVNDATEKQAVEISKRVMETLKVAGVAIGSIKEPEFHRSGGDHVHVVKREVKNVNNLQN